MYESIERTFIIENFSDEKCIDQFAVFTVFLRLYFRLRLLLQLLSFKIDLLATQLGNFYRHDFQ